MKRNAGRLVVAAACALGLSRTAQAASVVTGAATTQNSFYSASKFHAHWASTRYWVAYRNGTEVVISSSLDGLGGWTANAGILSFNPADSEWSVRYERNTVIVFARNGADNLRYYRKGTLNENGTINWNAAAANSGAGAGADGPLNSLIANGRPILWRAGAANSGNIRYGNQLDSPVVWTNPAATPPALNTGLPVAGTNGSFSAGALFPTGGTDPNDLIVLRATTAGAPTAQGHRLVSMRFDAGPDTFDASWYNVSTIGGSLGADNLTTEVRVTTGGDQEAHFSFSAARDTSGRLHAVYVNRNGDVVHYRRDAGFVDSWSRLSTDVTQSASTIGKVGLTAGIDNTLYLFYEKQDEQVYARRYDGTSWGGEFTLKGTADDLNQSLGLMETAESCALGVAWNENTLSPFEVMFQTTQANCGQMRVLSGSYTGDNVDGRSIFVGFSPDVVFVKRDGASNPVVTTSQMPPDNSKWFYDVGTAPFTGAIQSLTGGGFTVGNDPSVNAGGSTYHWIAFQAGAGKLKIGQYPGNNTDDRWITGLGYEPDFVITLPAAGGGGGLPLLRSSTMPVDTAYNTDASAFANAIQNQGPDGFQIGTFASVNTNLDTYYYIAWNAVPGEMAVGTYVGNGVDGRILDIANFYPEWVLIKHGGNTRPWTHKPASTGVGANYSLSFSASVGIADDIEALRPLGFRVDAGSEPAPDRTNSTGETYHYVGFGPHTPTTVNYRSIGVAPNYTTGTITVTLNSNVVNGSGTTWLDSNRGRGDRITINGVHYVVLSVVSNIQLLLTQPYAGASATYDGALGQYLIARQFPTPAAWENCIDGGAGTCAPFPNVTSSLVNDDRREVGIVYDDGSPYTAAAVDTEVLRVAGMTTDAAHTITLTADGINRHYGIPGDGVVFQHHPLSTGSDVISIAVPYVTVEWIEMQGGGSGSDGVEIDAGSGPGKVTVRNNLIHDIGNIAIQIQDQLVDVDIYNNFIYSSNRGIEFDFPVGIANILNNTVYNTTREGIFAPGSVGGVCNPCTYPYVVMRNNIVHTAPATDYSVPGYGPTSGTNISGPAGDASAPGAGSFGNVCLSGADCLNFISATDLHLQSTSFALDKGADLSAYFSFDIDGSARVSPWDIGADDRAATTEVELVSLEARGLDGAVALLWETASEISNLGFHLYRAESEEGPYARITSLPIPGLGSSPAGAKYSYRDSGLTNGATYFYKLEDIETTGKTALHGPVRATPSAGAFSPAPNSPSLITYGRPEANGFRVLEQSPRGVVVELTTEGFYAVPQEDGSVVLEIPGFEPLPGSPSVPVLRPWIDALSGKRVVLGPVRESSVESFQGLKPSGAETVEMVASLKGTVRALRGRARAHATTAALVPRDSARLVQVGFQGDVKKAQLELAPLRWNGASGELVLAKNLTVAIDFRGRSDEGQRRAPRGRTLLARLVTNHRGLHEVAFEELFSGGRGVSCDSLRLSRLGEPVALHVEPEATRFGPGSRLYFWSEGPAANPYGSEAVYELEASKGLPMEVASAGPSGEPVLDYVATEEHEENRYYQAGLLEAPDLWLWDIVMAPSAKAFPFSVSGLALGPARLAVRLQGVSDFPEDPDHHLRLYLNGTHLEEVFWDGKRSEAVELFVPEGVLREGDNSLEIENVGDTGATYSMVMLDRFDVSYPRTLSTQPQSIEGVFPVSGAAAAPLGPSYLLDLTGEAPRWLSGAAVSPDGTFRFRVEEARRYLAVPREAVRRPLVRKVASPRLKKETLQADYLVIGPKAFSSAASPLLEHRARQGLRAKFAAIEDVYSEFGFGETRPEAVRELLSYAYHHWRAPRVRYVLLLGDATYDFKDYLKTGVGNQAPPLLVKTSYLWTASDPAFAAVHGDDLLPDLALGRLPAKNPDELRAMVDKILAYESGRASLQGLVVLVADNPDRAGDFEANADELSTGVLAGREVRRLDVGFLGSATRQEILRSFDQGASLFSYIGHGGIHLWADENVFNTGDVASLAPQAQQPLVLTMNCLNGYFHFPYFDSLAESLLKAEGRGAIAAFSPSGLSLNEPAHLFHQALLGELPPGRHPRLGDAVLAAQEAYAATGAFPELLRIYHLLGDPALPLR